MNATMQAEPRGDSEWVMSCPQVDVATDCRGRTRRDKPRLPPRSNMWVITRIMASIRLQASKTFVDQFDAAHSFKPT
jgi:hypothetical protein